MEFIAKQTVNFQLIIQLIRQDLKHNQLTEGLRRLGLCPELHHLNLLEIVAGLMNRPPEAISEQWYDVYLGYLRRAASEEITERGDNLEWLAQECYEMLAGWVE